MAHWISQRLQTRKAQRSYNREWLTSRMFRRATWHRSTPEKATCDASLQSEGEHLWNSCCLLRRRAGLVELWSLQKVGHIGGGAGGSVWFSKWLFLPPIRLIDARDLNIFLTHQLICQFIALPTLWQAELSFPQICHVEAVSNYSYILV